ncbi:MAG: hypothetical protein HZB34_07870 [Nitrospirae bacterium]|nr:hypothetical protein [Nitrospirota bacterium]
MTWITTGRRRALSNILSLIASLAVTVWATPSEAVRPFVTDDARIVDKGQLETESFAGLELIRGQKAALTLATLEAVSVTDWLQITAGGIGLEYQDKRFTVLENLVFQPKILLHRSFGLIPSVTIAPSLLIPTSGNRQLWNSFIMAHISWFLFTPEGSPDPYDNGLAIHVNIGTKSQYNAGLGGQYTSKLYWAAGFEVITFSRELRFIAEAFNGDPFSFEDEFPAVQTGFRWYKTPDVQWDVVWRGSRVGIGDGQEAWENSVQIGLRVLFDIFK